MPAFGESLQCDNAPFTYNNTVVNINAPIGTLYGDHGFDIRGYGVGTITIADGEVDATEVKYEISIKSNKEDLLGDVGFVYPDINDDGSVARSRLIIETSRIPGVDDRTCMKFDIKVYVPSNLKKLHVASHTAVAHIQFAPGARIDIEELWATTYSMDQRNLVVASREVTAKKLSLEVYRGWIFGDAPIVEQTSVSTQRGDGIANVKFFPTANEKKAILRTTTGAGRSDFSFITTGEKRQIDSTHISSRNADMYLTYREAGFVGKVEIDSKSLTMTGATPWDIRRPGSTDESGEKSKWTHYVQDREGKDEIYVNSRGWAGLYF